ncbi:hypothetical protein BOTBODRAFT_92049, partial [Botryobasidium botryosum FD-172 SS1]
CMTGTRAKILKNIDEWLWDDASPHSLLWVHGHPGSGKSAIATSVAQSLHRAGALGASFFCKHDDEKLQDPALVMPTLVHQLAQVHKAYGKAVADVLGTDPHSGYMQGPREFESLVEQPIALVGKPTHTSLLVVVVDALDECGTKETCPPLLSQLVKLSTLAPWLKVVVTSRTLKYLSDCLEEAQKDHGDYLRCLDLDAERPADDLLHVTRQLLGKLGPHGWPGEPKLKELATHADGLFIWIIVACGFLTSTMSLETRERRLRDLLSGSTAGDPVGALWALYVESIPPGDDNHWEFQMVVGAMIATTVPLPGSALAALLKDYVQAESLHQTLEHLQSVLYVDSSKGNVVRVCRTSFSDFLTDKEHCPPEFYIEQPQHHARLTQACLSILVNGLRFNICNLESSHLFNAQVPNLENRVKEAISTQLEYSCLYWAHHLAQGERGSSEMNVVGLLHKFFHEPLVLYWVEALSLLGQLGAATPMLLQLSAWIGHISHQATMQRALASNSWLMSWDCCNSFPCPNTFYQPIMQSTPHLYVSALPFAPMHSRISSRFSLLFPNAIKVTHGQELYWPSLQHLLQGHMLSVLSVAYSPDGYHIVSGSADWTICIWDAKTGQLVGEPLRGHTDIVASVMYSPDGCHIVSGSGDKTICIWDAKTGQPVGEPLRGHTHSVNSVAYSPDGCHIVSGSWDGTICIWDAKTRQPVGRTLEGHTDGVFSVIYSPDGCHIVSGSCDKTACIWDAKTGQPVGKPLRGHMSLVYSVAYSPDGSHIASGSADKTICIWDAKTGQLVGEPLRGHTDSVVSVMYSPDGSHIVSGSHDKTICTWDAKTGWPVGEPLRGHTECISSVAYSPDGCHIVSGSDGETICIWDARIEQPVIAYSPDGCHIVSGSYDKTICIWDAKTGQPMGEPLRGHTDSIYSVAYSPDGCYIVSGSADNTICIWDVKTGQLTGEPLKGHIDSVHSVAYSPDSRYIVSGSHDGTVHTWDAKTGQPIGEPLKGHMDCICSAAYSLDRCHIVSGSDSEIIGISDAKMEQSVSGSLRRHTGTINSVAYSPCGCHIVSGSDNTIYIWDAKTGQPVGEPLRGHTHSVSSVAYSPDGCHIVSGSWDDTICIWNVKTGQPVGKPLRGHTNFVTSVAYSPDGCHIVSSSYDKTVCIWDVKAGQLVGDPLQHPDGV